MSMTAWSPRREIEAFKERFNRLLEDIDTWPREFVDVSMMAVDVQETDDKVVVKAEMPGIKAEDIEVDVRDTTLYLRGETKEEREESEGTWHRRERRIGRVERAVTLPAPVDSASADAVISDGVLTVTLPKREPTPTQKIVVKTS